MQATRFRDEIPWLLATLAVAIVLGGLVVGYEPVGGDPDRIYRPIKSELARALRQRTLPFWSDRFGLGIPLVAESHVAAFYPPNLVLYGMLEVPRASRLSMLLHMILIASTTYVYARTLGLTTWGSSLAAMAFALCGFEAIHSSHEMFVHALPYMPLVLLLTERYLATGRLFFLALVALATGLQLTLGHFQIQMMTAGLALFTALWRVVARAVPWPRLFGIVIAISWGAAIAAVQLGLSFDFASRVGQLHRPVADLAYYSFPPAHWCQLALPRFFKGLRGGPEDAYWFGQATTGYESALYVGTIPIILAIVGYCDFRRSRATNLWRILVILSFLLATMPRWWPEGYLAILRVPGLGYFRVPARYTVVTSLGLAILAGQGLDRAVSRRVFRVGIAAAVAFGVLALAWTVLWSQRSDFHSLPGPAGLPFGVASAVLAWAIGLTVIRLWRSERLGAWAPCLLTAIELGTLYHLGTTRWGWAVRLPEDSPVLSMLMRQRGVGRIAGALDDLPVRAGLTTASPYVGYTLPPPQPLLKQIQEAKSTAPGALLWLRRLGVTHAVWGAPVPLAPGQTEQVLWDPALDRLVYRTAGAPAKRLWRLVRYAEPLPEVRVATRTRTFPDRAALLKALSATAALNEAWYLAGDEPAGSLSARMARIVEWNGLSGTVEHDGPCDLILTRTFDPGWLARLGEGPEQSVARVEDGLQAVRISGAGRTRVHLRYRPRVLLPAAGLSASALVAAIAIAVLSGLRGGSVSLRSSPREEPQMAPPS